MELKSYLNSNFPLSLHLEALVYLVHIVTGSWRGAIFCRCSKRCDYTTDPVSQAPLEFLTEANLLASMCRDNWARCVKESQLGAFCPICRPNRRVTLNSNIANLKP